MVADDLFRFRNQHLLSLAVYLALITLMSASLFVLPDVLDRATAIALCLAFGVTHAFGLKIADTPRRIAVYFAVQTILVVSLLGLSYPSDLFNFLFFILATQAIFTLPARIGVAWVAAFYVLDCLSAIWIRGANGIINVLYNIPGFVLVGLFGHTIRQAESARLEKEQLLEELRSTQRQLRDLAVAEERNRLARDLHDSVKQQAFALSAQLDAVRSLLRRDPDSAEAHLGQAEKLADSLRSELATLILELRPAAIGAGGLAAALRRYAVEWSQQSRIAATVDVQGERALPEEIESALFRITQEALANVARHSRALTAEVRLSYAADTLTLVVQDSGQGFDPQQVRSGVGTQSMRERAASLPRGTLALDSAPETGTRVTVTCAA